MQRQEEEHSKLSKVEVAESCRMAVQMKFTDVDVHSSILCSQMQTFAAR